MSLAQCVLAASNGDVMRGSSQHDDGTADAGSDVAAAACKAAVAYTSYRATLVPFNHPWWRAPRDSLVGSSARLSSSSLLDMSSWLLPATASVVLHHHTADSAPSSPLSVSQFESSASVACVGFSAVLRGTTAFSSHGADALISRHQPVCSEDGATADSSDAINSGIQSSTFPAGHSLTLACCAISRIESIFKRSQCNHALLMLLAKAWAWSSLKAALSQLSSPPASANQMLQCISAAFPPPLTQAFIIPPTAPLSARLRSVAERLLELSSLSKFHPTIILCLALTSDIVIGMSCTLSVHDCPVFFLFLQQSDARLQRLLLLTLAHA